MDGGAWWAAVHGVARSRTRLSDFTLTFHFHASEEEMATHSSVLAWRIPGSGEPGGLPFMGSHRVGHDWSDLAASMHACLFWGDPHSAFQITIPMVIVYSFLCYFKIILYCLFEVRQLYVVDLLIAFSEYFIHLFQLKWKVKVKVKSLSPVQLFATPWTV